MSKFNNYKQPTLSAGFGNARFSMPTKSPLEDLRKVVGILVIAVAGATISWFGGKWMFSKLEGDKRKASKSEDGEKMPDNNEDSTAINEDDIIASDNTFLGWFMNRYPMPTPPPFLQKIMAGTPEGYEIATLLHLLSMLSALCFSKVRARYLDGSIHAPNLQVVIEGGYGQGKGKFNTMYETLFSRNIERDWAKLNDQNDSHKYIIQTRSVGISPSKLIDMMFQNEGAHLYLFAAEIKSLLVELKKSNGLDLSIFRHAFDNSPISRFNKTSDRQGVVPVFLNYTITGTPGDTKKFYAKELEGGTNSRICWGVIPQCGREIPKQTYPNEVELEKMRDQLDDWTRQYCYSTDAAGKEHAVKTTTIDLEYVCEALKEWLKEQYDRYQTDHNATRKDVRMRMATIAFHCAITLHMLYGCPSARKESERKQVVDMTIFIADYCMERYIHKFSEDQNNQRAIARDAERTTAYSTGKPSQKPKQPQKSIEELVAEWDRLQSLPDGDPNKRGWKALAKESGYSVDEVRNAVLKYRKERGAQIV